MSASKGERERIRRSRYQAIDFRTSHIADGWLHDPSHGQDQSPDEIIGRDNRVSRPATCRAAAVSAFQRDHTIMRVKLYYDIVAKHAESIAVKNAVTGRAIVAGFGAVRRPPLLNFRTEIFCIKGRPAWFRDLDCAHMSAKGHAVRVEDDWEGGHLGQLGQNASSERASADASIVSAPPILATCCLVESASGAYIRFSLKPFTRSSIILRAASFDAVDLRSVEVLP